MPTILDRIVAHKRQEIERSRAEKPIAELRAMLPDAPPVRDYLASLATDRPRDGGPIKLIAGVRLGDRRRVEVLADQPGRGTRLFDLGNEFDRAAVPWAVCC